MNKYSFQWICRRVSGVGTHVAAPGLQQSRPQKSSPGFVTPFFSTTRIVVMAPIRVGFSLACRMPPPQKKSTHRPIFCNFFSFAGPASRSIDRPAGCCPPSLEEKLGAASGGGGEGKDGAKGDDNENEFVRASKEKFSGGAQKAIDENSFFAKLR